MMESWKAIGRKARCELRMYRRIARHPRTPWPAKALLGLAVGYLMRPFDLIADVIPFVGHLDDLLIVPGVAGLAFKLIPGEALDERRRRASEASRIPGR
jgi:uncharacterized membrane protein YkvA (DUF1232 family)